MQPMTQAQGHANRAGNPSLCHQWMASTLRVLAMLVSIVAALLKMRPSRVPGECHTDVTPAALPEAGSNTIEETNLADANSETTEALMVSSTRSVRSVYPEPVEGSNHDQQ